MAFLAFVERHSIESDALPITANIFCTTLAIENERGGNGVIPPRSSLVIGIAIIVAAADAAAAAAAAAVCSTFIYRVYGVFTRISFSIIVVFFFLFTRIP